MPDYRSDSPTLDGQTLVLIVSGGIAAYKSCDIVRLLRKRKAQVQVVMTAHAEEFIGPITFQALTGLPVIRGMFDLHTDAAIAHTALADKASGVLIAPASANIIGKFAHGIADDFATTFLLASPAPVLIAPAMNPRMYGHAAVHDNIALLQHRGVHVIGPSEGEVACGHSGKGRMENPDVIVDTAAVVFSRRKDLNGKTVLITAGPTREALDPVRFLSNRSSGLMGYALAAAAVERGARVMLVSGPSSCIAHPSVELTRVESASDMFNEVSVRFDHSDVLIMAAAVADWSPSIRHDRKIKKSAAPEPVVNLIRTPDILSEISKRRKHQIIVGFAAESGDPEPEAHRKLISKNLDLIVANDIARHDAGFEVTTNTGFILSKSGDRWDLPLMSKRHFADHVIDQIQSIGFPQ